MNFSVYIQMLIYTYAHVCVCVGGCECCSSCVGLGRLLAVSLSFSLSCSLSLAWTGCLPEARRLKGSLTLTYKPQNILDCLRSIKLHVALLDCREASALLLLSILHVPGFG